MTKFTFVCQTNKIEDRTLAAIANKATSGMYSLRVLVPVGVMRSVVCPTRVSTAPIYF
jgi:hypothetical protein